jgi:hypothetical protein
MSEEYIDKTLIDKNIEFISLYEISGGFRIKDLVFRNDCPLGEKSTHYGILFRTKKLTEHMSGNYHEWLGVETKRFYTEVTFEDDLFFDAMEKIDSGIFEWWTKIMKDFHPKYKELYENRAENSL